MKEWIRAVRTLRETFIIVTVMEDNLTAKWTEKTYTSQIKQGIKEARKQARRVLAEMKEVLDDD